MPEISSNTDFNVNETNLRIGESGYARVNKQWCDKSINPPYSRLYYTIEGKGRITLEDSVVELEKNKVYLFPTGKPICSFYSYGMDQLYFHINIFNFEGYDILRECNVCASEAKSDAEFKYIISLYKSNDIMAHLELKQIIMSQCVDFMKQSNCSVISKKYSPVVKDAVAFIRKNPSIKLNVQELADSLFISKCALNNHFKKEIGKSVGRYIDETVLGEARYLLAVEETPVSKISERLGFCDQFYFSKKFSAHFGETPTAFRRHLSITKKQKQ